MATNVAGGRNDLNRTLEALGPLDRALSDAWRARSLADAAPLPPLRLRFDTGEVREVDPGWFLRGPDALDPLDRRALAEAREAVGAGRARGADRDGRGRVLDVGAGAGVHAVPLLESGLAVEALEPLPAARRILAARGVPVVGGDLWTEGPAAPASAVLALMNGTGLAGTAARLEPLLRRLLGFTAPGGVLLIDSTDPGEAGSPDGRTAGELQIQLEYDGRRGPPFPHLYVSWAELGRAARAVGWDRGRRVWRGPGGRYLARLTRSGGGPGPG